MEHGESNRKDMETGFRIGFPGAFYLGAEIIAEIMLKSIWVSLYYSKLQYTTLIQGIQDHYMGHYAGPYRTHHPASVC